MFKFIGSVIDTWWPFLVSIIASVGLAFVPSYWDAWNEWSIVGAWSILVAIFLLAGAGQIYGAYLSNKRSVNIEADLMSSLNMTLIPMVTDSLAAFNKAGIEGPEKQILVDSVMQHARAYVTSRAKEKVIVDANYYRLTDNKRTLIRANTPSNNARYEFKKTRGKQKSHNEENSVVDSVVNSEVIFCPDVTALKHQKSLSLDNSQPRNYVCFLTVPFNIGGVQGMISINADKKGAINKGMIPYLRIISRLIASLEIESAKQH